MVVRLGGSASEVLAGTGIADTLYGGGGNDTLVAFGGNNSLFGGDGNDNLVPGAGRDILIGGTGSDAVDYSDSGSGIEIDLSETNSLGFVTGHGGAAANDLLYSIETVIGSEVGDQLYGAAANDVFYGGAGADRLTGRGGHDYLLGGNGADSAWGGDGNDFLYGLDGADSLQGGAGNDQLAGGTGVDHLRGGGGNDHFRWSDPDESGVGAGNRDTVHDFQQGQDRLGLSLSGSPGTPLPGSFVGDSAFTASNQVRYRHQDGDTIVQGNSDTDLQAEIEIRLDGHFTLTAADFSLF